MKIRSFVPFCILMLFSLSKIAAHQVDVDEIMMRITQAKNNLVRESGLQEEQLAFLTIWNFDNTVLHGDSTEGLVDGEGKVIFKGLAQVAIEAGFSKKYPSQGGFDRFWKDYQKMEEIDEPKAYAYVAQILAGAKESDVLNLSINYFDKTLKPHFFKASKDLIAALQSEGIQTTVITASPGLFVQGAGPLLNISRKNIYGMETVAKQGILTDQMVLPLTTRQGKVEKIEQIIQDILKSKPKIKKVYVLAGFGNNNANDLVFLKWIANQQLPEAVPVSVVGFQAPSLPQNFVTLLLSERAD